MTSLTEVAKREKRKVHRSPSYPAFDLSEAIQKANAVYKQEKRTATTPEVIASHIGYSQTTGPGGRAVSALRQYGLIEESAGRYQISDLGYTLIHFDHDSNEWKSAVWEAAKRPVLFRELIDKFGIGLPSDATLRNELLSRGFNPSAVSDALAVLRNTLALASQADPNYSNTEERIPMAEPLIPPVQLSPMPRPGTVGSELSIPIEFSADGQQAVVARVLFNAPIKREYLTRLKSFLDAWEKAMPQ